MIPEIKWYQKYDRIVMKFYMSNVEFIEQSKSEIVITDLDIKFKYDDYNFSQTFANEFIDNKVEYFTNYIKVSLLKKAQMDEWEYLFKDRVFNKSYVKIDWNNWSLENDQVTSMFNTEYNNSDRLKEMMAQYQKDLANSKENPDSSEGGNQSVDDNTNVEKDNDKDQDDDDMPIVSDSS